MTKINQWLLLLGVGLLYLVVFKVFLLSGHLVWGDAPFFYPENLKELFNKPLLWDIRNDNLGADQSGVLWLFIPTYLFGLLNHWLGFDSDLLIRLIFYFPATILAFWGAFVLIGRFSKNLSARIIGSALYLFNSYFLTIIDGGQIGVMLSYGLFPVVVSALLNYFESKHWIAFYAAVGAVFLISNVDIRIAILATVTGLILALINPPKSLSAWIKQLFLKLLAVGVILIGLDAFWLLPLVGGLGSGGVLSELSGNAGVTKLINSLLLNAANFPLNEFGTAMPVPFWMSLWPLFIFSGLMFKKSAQRQLLWLFLVYLGLAFLAKGGNDPFGLIFSWITMHLPFGYAFRDSTKFFVPLMIVASISLAISLQKFEEGVKNYQLIVVGKLIVVGLLIVSIYPALSGSLTGILTTRLDGDYQKIYQNIKQDEGFGRSLWFPERFSLGFGDWSKPALSANLLYREHPIASLIEGDYDLFGFLHSDLSIQWFNLLGIKYVLTPENSRKKIWTAQELKDRVEFVAFVESRPFWQKSNWQLPFPSFQVEGGVPHIFGQKKIFLVLGGDSIYDQLRVKDNFNLADQGLVYLESGQLDPADLAGLNPENAALVSTNGSFEQLSYYFLQDKFLKKSSITSSQWKMMDSGDYLSWKYELLKGGIKTQDYDYGRGVAFSSIGGEKIRYQTNIPSQGQYYLAIRQVDASRSAGIKVSIDGYEEQFKSSQPNDFEWQLMGPLRLDVGRSEVIVTNRGGFGAVNTLAIISQNDYQAARERVDELRSRLKTSENSNNSDLNWLKVDYQMENPTEYRVKIPEGVNWLILTDHYNPGWQLDTRKSWPFYAMINGFKVDSVKNEARLYYQPQDLVNQGLIITGVSFGIFLGWGIFLIMRKRSK